MNTKSKLKAISIGIAAIMMVSLFAVTTASASIVTDCWIGEEDNKVYFTVHSGEKVDRANGQLFLNGAYSGEHRMFSLTAGETATLSFRHIWNGVDDVEVRNDVDDGCCIPAGPTPQPDLIVSDKWEESVNEQVIVHFIIENIGEADAGASTACLEINGIYGTASVPALKVGESHVGAFDPEPCPPLTTITVTVCADNDDVVEESDETNNCMRNDFTCPAKPDLVVSGKWEECVDGQVIVHFIIANIGDAEAGESYATLYIDDTDVKLQNVWVPEIGPGGMFTDTFEPEDCPPGTTISVWVCADDTNMVDESDEYNCWQNEFTCPIQPKPDLVVIGKSEECVDGQVIVHFIIENIGDADAGESYATLYIDDMLVEDQNVWVPALGPDGRFTSEFAAEDCPPGKTIAVTVCADDTNMVDEISEYNNCKRNDFTCPIQPKPDLVVSDKYETVDEDGKVIVHFEIHNQGDADAGASFATKYLFIDGKLVEKHNAWVPALGPSGRFNGAFKPEDCPPGKTITVRVCADDTHVVDESDELNNCWQNDFTCPIPGKPDLVVSEKWEVCEDEQVIVHFVVKNKGDAEAGKSEAALYIDGVRVQTQNVPVSALGPSGTFAGEFAPEDCPPGMTFTFTVCADDTHVVDESEEENNCWKNDFTCPIPGMPDLVVEDIREESVKANGHVIVHFEIHNQGDVDAGASFATKYLYIDGELVEQHNAWVPALGPSGRYNGAFEPEECPVGKTITIKVCADDTHVVDESNEDNNCMTNDDFICPPEGPDLVIEKTVVMKEYDCDEYRYKVYYKITNIGNEVADWCCGDNTVALLVDDLLLEEDDDIPALGPGASYEGAFEGGYRGCGKKGYECPCGKPFDVTVYADYYNAVDESIETNNWETNHEFCGIPGMEVIKKVRHEGKPGVWHDSINAEHCDNVVFEGTVTNTGCCCNLTNIKVTDVLSPSLEYEKGSATPTPDSVTITDGTTTITWTTPLLEYCEETTYGLTAHVIGCGENGLDTNTITAKATTCTDEKIAASDYAEVYAPPEAKVTVDKKVLNVTSGQYVDAINVLDGDDVKFRCIVHNEGTCHDLWDITVWDILSDSLTYNWSEGPNGQQPVVGPLGKILEWDIPNRPLMPCQTLTFFINATVSGKPGDVDTNTVRVTAWSQERGTVFGVWLDEVDEVEVTIIPD